MVSRHYEVIVAFNPPAAHFTDTFSSAGKIAVGCGPHQQEDLRLDQTNLGSEQTAASLGLFFPGVSVVGRAALDDIANVVIFLCQLKAAQECIKQFTGTAHKGQSLLIFIGPRSLTHNHERSIYGATPDDHILSALRQFTVPAGETAINETLPGRINFTAIIHTHILNNYTLVCSKQHDCR